MSTAGWHPDPSGRYEHRYHNGVSWTADVAVGGRRYVDPAGAQPPPAPPGGSPPPRGRSSGPAVAALVCGIVATAAGWLPFVAVLTSAAAVVAVILGRRARRAATRDGAPGGLATAGLVLGFVGIAMSALGIVFTVAMYRALEAFLEPADHETAITSCGRDGDVVRAEGSITNRDPESATFTVYVELAADDSGIGDEAVEHAVVEDVAASASAPFAVSAVLETDDGGEARPSCDVRAVHGPLPFGVDPGPNPD